MNIISVPIECAGFYSTETQQWFHWLVSVCCVQGILIIRVTAGVEVTNYIYSTEKTLLVWGTQLTPITDSACVRSLHKKSLFRGEGQLLLCLYRKLFLTEQLFTFIPFYFCLSKMPLKYFYLRVWSWASTATHNVICCQVIVSDTLKGFRERVVVISPPLPEQISKLK